MMRSPQGFSGASQYKVNLGATESWSFLVHKQYECSGATRKLRDEIAKRSHENAVGSIINEPWQPTATPRDSTLRFWKRGGKYESHTCRIPALRATPFANRPSSKTSAARFTDCVVMLLYAHLSLWGPKPTLLVLRQSAKEIQSE